MTTCWRFRHLTQKNSPWRKFASTWSPTPTVSTATKTTVCLVFPSNLVNALLLLEHHTPALVPLEFALSVAHTNSRHPELPDSGLFSESLPREIVETHDSPAVYLMKLKPDIFSLSDSFGGENGGYLARLLTDLGLNRYAVIRVDFWHLVYCRVSSISFAGNSRWTKNPTIRGT